MCLEHVWYINRPKDVVSWVKGRIRFHLNPNVFHIINIDYCHGLETKKKRINKVLKESILTTFIYSLNIYSMQFLKNTENVISSNIAHCTSFYFYFFNEAHNFFIFIYDILRQLHYF